MASCCNGKHTCLRSRFGEGSNPSEATFGSLAQLDNIEFFSTYDIFINMEKNFLEKMINDGKSTYQIAKESDKAANTVRYWLNKFGLKTKHSSFKNRETIEYGNSRFCPCCKLEKNILDFYNRRNKIGSSVYCKKCSNKESVNRHQVFKKRCVEYKGGNCEICGYNKYIGALDFHHKDPLEKEFNLSKVKSHKFSDKIKEELDKCILVCSNCHREIHGSLV